MPERPGDMSGFATAQKTFFVLGSIGLVVAALYLGQRIFVPLALAILLTLVLGPVVIWLERRGLRRLPAVLSAALLAFVLVGLAGWAVAAQVTSLLADLPAHKAKIREKLAPLHGGGRSSPLNTVKELLKEVEKAAAPDEPAAGAGPAVRVEPARPSLLAEFEPVVGRVAAVASLGLVVMFLVVTLLLYREDTRNRLIRLAGRGRLTITTRALDEAGRRIGGYLLGHAAVNAGFGAATALGMFLLDVPYPVLWGMLAGAFRFVPSVGIWLVAPLPAALAYIAGTGWLPPLLVLGLFLVLELLTGNVAEPRVCGKSVGLAPVPLLLAVTFWTSLWGLVGLVLATPVTVCLAVLGRHVRQLHFLALLLGKEAALGPATRYYQRLLARDRCEAEAVVKEYLAGHSIEDLFDRVLVPALVLVRRGRKAGELRPQDEEFILRTTTEIVHQLEVPAEVGADQGAVGQVAVLGVPAADGADEVALAMLRALVCQAEMGVRISTALPNRGVRASDEDGAPTAVLVAAVGPGGLTEARYLCRRLRDQYPGAKIVVGRFGRGTDPRKARTLLLSAGADRVTANLREARDHLARLAPPRPFADRGSTSPAPSPPTTSVANHS
jgi:predicted PurR-regulated permease PerM